MGVWTGLAVAANPTYKRRGYGSPPNAWKFGAMTFVHTTLRIPGELNRDLRRIAGREKTALSVLIRNILERSVEAYKNGEIDALKGTPPEQSSAQLEDGLRIVLQEVSKTVTLSNFCARNIIRANGFTAALAQKFDRDLMTYDDDQNPQGIERRALEMVKESIKDFDIAIAKVYEDIEAIELPQKSRRTTAKKRVGGQ